ncbi:hypothetical protein Tco_0875025 [Tanacetum coccineum]|uniref:Uncharacterized protein n=1 Tax=Tanacetum coccineum TaxID=301880 RepID=A0ABQ5BT62_9ASTR
MISRIYKVFGVVFMKKRRLRLKEHDEVVEGFHTSNDVQKDLKMLLHKYIFCWDNDLIINDKIKPSVRGLSIVITDLCCKNLVDKKVAADVDYGVALRRYKEQQVCHVDDRVLLEGRWLKLFKMQSWLLYATGYSFTRYQIVHGFGSQIEQDALFKEKLTD